jgi:ribosomal protein L11 methyltransferase
VPVAREEEARAAMVALFPGGFEEVERPGELELAAYTDAAGEARLQGALGEVASSPVSEGWEEAWKQFHRPTRIGPLWVGPPWEESDAGALGVVVDPGRAFGTGTHPTTRLCLELLVEQERTSLVDLGCGSGVVAVAAAKLGFAPVIGLDSEVDAVDAARANALANGVEIEVRHEDVLSALLPEAGLAVANIDLPIVERLASRVRAPLLIASGYLEGVHPRASGWQALERREMEGWAADVLRGLPPGGRLPRGVG